MAPNFVKCVVCGAEIDSDSLGYEEYSDGDIICLQCLWDEAEE